MGKIKEAVRKIWNLGNASAEKNIWKLLGYSGGVCPLSESFNRYERSIKGENTNSVETDSSSKTTKTAKTVKADKRLVMVDKIRRIKNVLRFKRRDKKLWWGDREGACPVGQSLRAINVHGRDVLNTFFKKESKGTLYFGNMSSFPTVIIIAAEINARVKEHERLRSVKEANFIRLIRGMKKK